MDKELDLTGHGTCIQTRCIAPVQEIRLATVRPLQKPIASIVRILGSNAKPALHCHTPHHSCSAGLRKTCIPQRCIDGVLIVRKVLRHRVRHRFFCRFLSSLCRLDRRLGFGLCLGHLLLRYSKYRRERRLSVEFPKMDLQRRDILDIRIISWLYRRSIRRRREKAG